MTDTHARSTLVDPATIAPGDLIFYMYDWHPVTSVEVTPWLVFVFFTDLAARGGERPEWKPYQRDKRARCRRRIA